IDIRDAIKRFFEAGGKHERAGHGRDEMANKLRDLVAPGKLASVMSAHNPLSARLAELAGFDGIWASGFELSAAYGVPDASLLSFTQHLEMTRAIVEQVAAPVVADLDTGYGNAINVMHVVGAYARAGVAAVVIEEALRRGSAYAEAGADMILVHSKRKTPDEIVDFAQRWQSETRLVVVPTAYPDLTEARIRQLGNIGMVIYCNHVVRAAVTAMRQIFAEIRADGGIHNIDKRIASVEEIFELQRVAEMKRLEQKYLR